MPSAPRRYYEVIDQNAVLGELPTYWQEQIRALRAENAEVRNRLRGDGASLTPELDELPRVWRKRIVDLRKENASYRTQRNQARAEVAALRAELGR
jgi:chromosome segregation ATPase